MSGNFTNDGVLIAKVMRDHLNTWEKRPVDFLLEDLGKYTPSMMIQQLAAAQKIRSYVNGSYIGSWNFAIYIRVCAEDTSSRLNASGCLEELANWLQARDDTGAYTNLPIIDENRKAMKIEMTSTPSLAARYENGVEDYQALFTLEYQVRRNNNVDRSSDK